MKNSKNRKCLISKTLIIISLFVFINACNDDDVFQREQYKIVFALVSEDGYNIFSVVHDLEEVESTGYIAASVGGTNSTQQPVEVAISYDMEAFDDYNTSNFDVDFSNYAILLPGVVSGASNNRAKYRIDDYNLTIPTGERSGLMAINVRPDGLSPDSTYFIPLKIERYNQYEANPNKSNVLYRVLIKNLYATTEMPTNYNMRAYRGEVFIPGVKRMHPISRNKVRIMADNIAFEEDLEVIDRNAIVLEITPSNQVIITSWKDMVVTQIDGDPEYPNTFDIVDDGFRKFKTFLLRYDYRNVNGVTVEMKEELRMELTE